MYCGASAAVSVLPHAASDVLCAGRLKEHGNTLYRHRDASRALHWYHKAASYLELEFSDEMQRAKEASAPHRVAAFTQLRVGQTVFVVPTKYARIVLRAERMARKASARAETARKGWARPPIATETLALQVRLRCGRLRPRAILTPRGASYAARAACFNRLLGRGGEDGGRDLCRHGSWGRSRRCH